MDSKRNPLLAQASASSARLIGTINRAVERAGGIRALGRELDWKPTALHRVLAGEKISAFRAGQVADYLGFGIDERDFVIRDALLAMARTDTEVAYWSSLRDEAYLRNQARQRALKIWFAGGDEDPKILEGLERVELELLRRKHETLQDERKAG